MSTLRRRGSVCAQAVLDPPGPVDDCGCIDSGRRGGGWCARAPVVGCSGIGGRGWLLPESMHQPDDSGGVIAPPRGRGCFGEGKRLLSRLRRRDVVVEQASPNINARPRTKKRPLGGAHMPPESSG